MNDLNEDEKKAIKAFKKRLKMNQLEEDSKLGRSHTTGARNSIVAIRPPAGFAPELWQALVDKGYLRPDGGNFFTLVPGK